jgi:hypothetical protein
MSPVTWVCAGIFVAIAVGVARMSRRGMADIVTLVVMSFGLYYGLRIVLLAAGLDAPSPEDQFPSATFESDFCRAVLGASAFLATMGLGIFAATRPGMSGWAPFLLAREAVPGRQLRITVAITGCSVAISAYLLARFGAPGDLIAAAKYDKALAGYYIFRVFPAVGSVVAAGAFLDTLRARRSLSAAVCLACTALNGAAVFLWGSRGVLVAAIVVIAIGLGRSERLRGTGVGGRLVAAVAVVAIAVGAAASLRVARDQLTQGDTQAVIADASGWRQASLATNAVYLDAAVLAFRDVPSPLPSRNGEDFANGLRGFVPRSLWPGKPENIAPGSWFRREYEPRVVNGWPMGSPALWYINFGWLGVPLGGLLSGLAVGLVAARQRRTPDSGHNLAAVAATGIFVLSLGWDSQTPYYVLLWLVPLWLVGRYVESPDALRARSATPRRANLSPT